ncbi:CPBP family intramembrane glutamic endopeptidase [Halobaculum roseum]|uniref:CPBP family intramembrane glutamic endopeptidase n=1 Tax=Halobaculum roseum TaxID=2175149 RepID=A0ABD5MN74_9EURY|nr:CPBP family intramembrane glutamic endopeptidase [Halobaculum roseum]QZY02397.1 CPBP family intramembrane metalloprotease [Halobaculum roseum]
MTRWTAFAGLATVVLLLLLGLARLSEAQFAPVDEPAARGGDRTGDGAADGATGATGGTDAAPEAHGPTATPSRPETPSHPATTPDADRSLSAPERSPVAAAEAEASLSAGVLLANVALSQGVFGAMLVAAAVWADVPAAALGLVPAATLPDLALGVGLGAALWLASEAGGRLAERVGIEVNEALRGALAPDTLGGWAILLLAVLPTVALFEEFLFRAVLVGAFGVGLDAPAWLPATIAGLDPWPWLLAAGSSVAFALGHGAQGRAGIVATGALGFVLAGAFVLTGSFALVVVAHYLVNALTLVVHEFDPAPLGARR